MAEQIEAGSLLPLTLNRSKALCGGFFGSFLEYLVTSDLSGGSCSHSSLTLL